MSDPYFNNELMLAAMSVFTTTDASFTDAEQAFLQTRGDFKAKLTAALRIMTIAKLKPEKFFAIPEDLESLSKQELVDLFPRDGGVFVRSNASKDDLRDALRQISRRNPRVWTETLFENQEARFICSPKIWFYENSSPFSKTPDW